VGAFSRHSAGDAFMVAPSRGARPPCRGLSPSRLHGFPPVSAWTIMSLSLPSPSRPKSGLLSAFSAHGHNSVTVLLGPHVHSNGHRGRSRRQFLSEGRERPVLTGGCRAQQHRGPGVVTVVPFLSPCLSLVPRGWGGRHAGCGHSSGKRKRVKGLLMTLGFLQGSGKALVTPLWPQVWEKAQATGPRTLTLRGPSCPSLRPVPPPVGRVGERGTTGLV
jgi:hypothetical protein